MLWFLQTTSCVSLALDWSMYSRCTSLCVSSTPSCSICGDLFPNSQVMNSLVNQKCALLVSGCFNFKCVFTNKRKAQWKFLIDSDQQTFPTSHQWRECNILSHQNNSNFGRKFCVRARLVRKWLRENKYSELVISATFGGFKLFQSCFPLGYCFISVVHFSKLSFMHYHCLLHKTFAQHHFLKAWRKQAM